MWTYAHLGPDGCPGFDRLPPENSIVRVFDRVRWSTVVGLHDPVGIGRAVLVPSPSVDCQWIAWAPLNERSRPDVKAMSLIFRRSPAHDPTEPVIHEPVIHDMPTGDLALELTLGSVVCADFADGVRSWE